jgi:hypothetical protein
VTTPSARPKPLGDSVPREAERTPMAKDTSQLLRTGMCLLMMGLASILLVETVFGGIHQHGPHTDAGWLFLMVAMACLPLGALLLLLGGAKWIGRRHG